MDAATILATKPRKLFAGDETAVKRAFRKLVAIWHPDRCTDPMAAEVIAHLTRAKEAVLNGGNTNSITLERQNGTKFRMDYIRHCTIDNITVFTGATSVAYLIPNSISDLARAAQNHRWKFANKKMEDEMQRFLPPYVRTENLKDGMLMVYRRTSSQILMRDLMSLHVGRIPPVHVSWMITRMNNIACYLEWAKMSHFAMLPEFLLVDLDSHGVCLVGPPLFLTEEGKRPLAVPQEVISMLPALRDKGTVAASKHDRLLIRETAMALLGSHGGVRLKNDPEVRDDVANWVISPPAPSAPADYEKWESALGPRKFIKFETTAEDLYS